MINNPIDLIKIGKLVKDARIKLGITQQELAGKVGVGLPIVSYIENGRRAIPKKKIAIFSEKLGIAEEKLKSEGVSAREIRDEMEVLQREAGISFRNLQTLTHSSKIELLNFYKQLKNRAEKEIPVSTVKDPDAIIKEIFKKCRIKQPPVNLYSIAKTYDIEIQESRTIQADGWIIYPKGESWAGIKYRAGMADGRTRFTIAHELGHFFLHNLKDAEQSCYMWESASNGNDEGNRKREKEAHLFASNLLMPKEWVRKELPKKIRGLRDIRGISQLFEVSLTAAAIRLTQVTAQPCAVIHSKMGKIVWSYVSDSLRNQSVRVRASAEPLDKKSQAYQLCHKVITNDSAEPVKTLPLYWFNKSVAGAFKEHSVCIFDQTVLSLVWTSGS